MCVWPDAYGLPPTGETSIAPLWSYSQDYARQPGSKLVRFTLKPGTSDSLLSMGGYNNTAMLRYYPDLPHAASGWRDDMAGIKFEGQDKYYVNDGLGIINTQLGQGPALELFNNNILQIQLLNNK